MVVFDISSLVWVDGFVDAGMRHIDADPLPEGTGNRVSGVYPTVSVEHIFGYVLGMHTVNRITYVLSGRHNETEGQHKGHGDAVVQAKDGRVDSHVTDFGEAFEAPEYVQHLERWSLSNPANLMTDPL